MRRVLLLALFYALCAAGAERPQRIVSLSPDLTEIVYGVGGFDRGVAGSDYDPWPAATAKLPHLGQLHSPSFEKLVGLRPDLVIVNKAQAPFFEATLKDLG